MKTIWKFRLPSFGLFTAQLPKGAEVISVAEQFNVLYTWVIVDPTQPLEPRDFTVCYTGYEIPEDKQFIGTVHAANELVLHVFVDV